MHLGARHDVEGERQQRVAGKNRGRFVEGLVDGWPPAAQVVIVHRRQIVMHQRIAMHAFERGARHQRACGRGAEQRRGLDDQKRAQALAAVEGRMAHGRKQARRTRDFAGERRVGQQLASSKASVSAATRPSRAENSFGPLFIVALIAAAHGAAK